jgi:hypothetical protein
MLKSKPKLLNKKQRIACNDLGHALDEIEMLMERLSDEGRSICRLIKNVPFKRETINKIKRASWLVPDIFNLVDSLQEELEIIGETDMDIRSNHGRAKYR